VDANSIHINQRVKGKRVEFTADKPFQHFTVELIVESSLAQGNIGQTGWATLPLLILLVTSILHWEKLSPHAKAFASSIEDKLMKKGSSQKRVTNTAEEMSNEDLDKTVKLIEGSKKRKSNK